MKKNILVTAIITIEGEDLNKNFISSILKKIKKYFLYRFKYDKENVTVVKIDISDNYVEIQS